MDRPTVSVIMNCLNGARYLAAALDSVYAQTFPDWEIIFWDDGSTDFSAALARSYGAKLRYFRGPGNTPLGQARNLAFQQSEGRYLAILDVDDTWEREKLMRQVDYMEKHETVALVATDCWFMDAAGHRGGTFFGRTPFPDGDPYRALLTGSNFLASPTLMFRIPVVLCQSDLRYAELFDLCVEVAKYAPIAALPQVLASYRVHPGNRGGTGCLGMTKEVLAIMRRHRAGAPWSQHVRELVLSARYGWQALAHS